MDRVYVRMQRHSKMWLRGWVKTWLKESNFDFNFDLSHWKDKNLDACLHVILGISELMAARR